ncbi:GH92 family glycosyl hydrolase [Sedimentisphaera salicampi]|nr:GH92 family glycosyl hydrolase [Sedimentisphaera salicampi]
MMKKRIFQMIMFSFLLTPFAAFCEMGSVKDDFPLVQKVNPFVGTDTVGHTFPGATVPFGMVQLSPDTDNKGWNHCSGYHYKKGTIMGFSHTHLSGTGVPDYGDFLFMPTTGDPKLVPGSEKNPEKGYRSRFSHDREDASPGYYSVYLEDYDIDVELTATERVGFHKYTFPETDKANVIVDVTHIIGWGRIVESEIEIIDNRQIQGFFRKNGWSKNRYLYFTAEFSRPFQKSGLRINGRLDESAKEAKGKSLQGYFRFDAREKQNVMVKVALSNVSCYGAAKNMQAECPGWDFEKVHSEAKSLWQKQLSKFEVKGGSESQQRTFYTSVYHSFLVPNIFMDVDGRYRGMDKKIHTAEDFDYYTVFSLWDTFRALHPLYTIVEQDRTNDFVHSMLKKYDQSGLLPYWELASGETWCMIGYHSIPVIADAWVKGIRGYDPSYALKAMKNSAMQDHQGLKAYKKYGYIPLESGTQSVSRTLEYAYDDWCIAAMADDLGRTEDWKKYQRRSQNYRNVFDVSTGFMRGKNKNGFWRQNFDPAKFPSQGASEYTEANSWQYTWFVPHDVNGLIDLMGGDDAFIGKLDKLFNPSAAKGEDGHSDVDITGMIGQYAHGNEPSHTYAYLYSYAGSPWKTQEKIAQIVNTLYSDQPDGLCGNDDCGQMSAWYVFSTMGMYPVCPGQPIYVFGTPMFPEASINLENGKEFRIIAENHSDKNIYVQSVTLNGRPYSKTYIHHDDIIGGGELVFKMGSEPNKSWGSSQQERPSSNPGKELTLMPYLKELDQAFTEDIIVNINCDDSEAEVYFTLDGSEPDKSSNHYTEPFKLSETTTLKAKAFKRGAMPSYTLSALVERKTLEEPADISRNELASGLNYSVYVGSFRSVLDLADSKVKKSGTSDNIDLTVTNRRDNFGLKFTGYFKVEKEGMYRFKTISDDGSRLYVNSELVVNNDGFHGAQAADGMAALKAGFHEIKVLYFEGNVDEALSVEVAEPDGDFRPFSHSELFRKK